MDKELALILAELLIKQDETTSQVKGINVRLDETNAQLDQTNTLLGQTIEHLNDSNSILRDFMAASVKQWNSNKNLPKYLQRILLI